MILEDGTVPQFARRSLPEETVFPRTIDGPSLYQRSHVVNCITDISGSGFEKCRPEIRNLIFKTLTESSLWQVWPKGFGLT